MKEHDNLAIDFLDIQTSISFDRREFLKLFGGGLFILFSVRESLPFQEQSQQRRFRPQLPEDFNAFLKVGEDGRVSCFTGKVELGQGVITSLAQMLADELDVVVDVVDMVMGDTDLCPWDMGTFGSMTTRFFGPPLRAAAAEARAVLLELASERLSIPVDQLDTKEGIIFEKNNPKNRVTYAQLTKGKSIAKHLQTKPPVKDHTKFTVVGTPVNRKDGRVKVTGEAKYAGDIQIPDMMYASILRPPAHDAVLKNLDVSAVKSMNEILLVQDDDLVAVLHRHPDSAAEALKKIKADYETPSSDLNEISIFDHLLKVAPPGEPVASGGILEAGRNLSDFIFEEKYLDGYVAHAPIEPHTATAKVEGDKVIVWASTQTPFSAKEEIAQVLGIPSKNVRIITPFVGGGYGGKTRNQQAVEAARLAKLTGKPVQVAWNRAEEFFYDSFRPAAVVKISSGITKAGRISLWDYSVYFAGERGSVHFYDIPHHRTVAHGSGWRGDPGSHPFSTGPWRAPANNTNTFARESQVDIMAAKAGIDPLEFRLANLKDPQMIRVLKAVAEKFGWTPAKAPSGRGYGVACGTDAGTYVAHMAEVEVDRNTGHVQVKRVNCAQDMGLSVNPLGAKLQIEGCITMGLGYALTEDVRFQGGKILDLNFDTYDIPRFSWVPEIETVLVEAKDKPPQGGGEPAIIAMGAVIANAIFDAVGARLHQLPMIPERVKAALAKDPASLSGYRLTRSGFVSDSPRP